MDLIVGDPSGNRKLLGKGGRQGSLRTYSRRCNRASHDGAGDGGGYGYGVGDVELLDGRKEGNEGRNGRGRERDSMEGISGRDAVKRKKLEDSTVKALPVVGGKGGREMGEKVEKRVKATGTRYLLYKSGYIDFII